MNTLKRKKKLVGILTAMVMALCTVMPTSFVWADSAGNSLDQNTLNDAGNPTYIAVDEEGSKNYNLKDKDGNAIKCDVFFANGTPITISAKTGNDTGNDTGAVITWGDNSTREVSENAWIFGGGQGDAKYKSSNITMEGGTVYSIYGGGANWQQFASATQSANVGIANITVNGGTVKNLVNGGGLLCTYTGTVNMKINGGEAKDINGGALAYAKAEGTTAYDAGAVDVYTDSTKSKAIVDETNVEIKGVNLTGNVIYGGGQGHSYTKEANLTITSSPENETYEYVTAGGANGRTDKGTLTINGGLVGVAQTINRGTMGEASITVNGGTVEKLFAGGEDPETTAGDVVNGAFEANGTVTAKIAKLSAVTNAYIGSGLSKAIVSLTGNYKWDPHYNTSRPVSNKIEQKGSWTVEADSALTVDVTSGEKLLKEVTNEGTIINNGTLEIKNGSTVTNKGTIKGSGTITNAGTLDNDKGNLEYDNEIDGNGTVEGDSLLKIGSSYYKSFDVAHTALQDNNTLTVIRDINTATTPWNFNTVKKAALDLNGHELKSTSGEVLKTSGTKPDLTIKDTSTEKKGEIASGTTGPAITAQSGKLTVNSGTVTGTTGIQMWAGDLNVSGGAIEATGTTSNQYNGSGAIQDGAAISLVKTDSATPKSVSITGGTIDASADAIQAHTVTGNTVSDWATPPVSVRGGSFNKKPAYIASGYQALLSGGRYVVSAIPTPPVPPTEPAVPEAAAITLNSSALSLEEGQTGILSATVTPDNAKDKTVSWSSSNPAVATVSGGVVTAVKEGTASITASTVNGKTAVCSVTVKAKTGTEGEKEVIVEAAPSADGTVVLNDAITKAIQSAAKDTAIVLAVKPAKEGTAPAIDKAVFEAAKAAADQGGSTTLIIQTEPTAEDSIPAIFQFDISQMTADKMAAVKTEITKTQKEEVKEAIAEELPKTAKTIPVSLAHEGNFPAPAKITMVLDNTLFKQGDTAYLYYFDPQTKTLSLTENGSVTVGEQNKVTFTLKHASDYVITNEGKAPEEITVSPSAKTLEVGKSTVLKATPEQKVEWSSDNANVAAVDESGKVTAKAAGFAVITAKTQNGLSAECKVKVTPAVPTHVNAVSTGSSSIKVSWNKANGADKYLVYQSASKSGEYKKIKRTTGTSITVSKLTTGKAYYYKVKAYVAAEDGTIYSKATVAAGTKPTPAAPAAISAKAGKGSVTISWKKVSSVDGYRVYRATSKNGSYSKLKTLNASTSVKYTDQKLKEGKKYYYKARAFKKQQGKTIFGTYSKIVLATAK